MMVAPAKSTGVVGGWTGMGRWLPAVHSLHILYM